MQHSSGKNKSRTAAIGESEVAEVKSSRGRPERTGSARPKRSARARRRSNAPVQAGRRPRLRPEAPGAVPVSGTARRGVTLRRAAHSRLLLGVRRELLNTDASVLPNLNHSSILRERGKPTVPAKSLVLVRGVVGGVEGDG
jgi:hypothetical protein